LTITDSGCVSFVLLADHPLGRCGVHTSHDRFDMEKPDLYQATSTTNPLQDLTRRLYCPEPKVKQVETNPETSLSHIPWQLYWQDNGTFTSSSSTTTTETTTKQPRHVEASSSLPSSYLDLRRQQNVAFADLKCQQANQASLTMEQTTAVQSLFEQALDLVPDHVDSLLGYGKLLFKTGHLVDAQDKFRDVLEIDPNNLLAIQYLKSLELTQHLQHSKANTVGLLSRKHGKTLTMRESSAFHDALLERRLALEVHNDGEPNNNNNNDDATYNDDDDDDDADSRNSHKKDKKERDKKRKRKKKDKKKKYKRRSRHRRRYDSDSSSTTGGSRH
jgi:tetratricopeptide (TPR) repeat protein